VADYKDITYNELTADIRINPNNYTVWFREIFEKVQLHKLKSGTIC